MEKVKNTRQQTRFPPLAMEVAEVSLNPEASILDFRGDMVALVVDESPLGGCCLVVCRVDALHPGDFCVLRVGQQIPVSAEVRWRRDLGESVAKVGLQFLFTEPEATRTQEWL